MKNIVFENVKKAYGKNVVVEDLCMEVKEGERLILLGPSGCGKSTTLRMIAGLENVTAGNLWMRDQVVNDVPCGERGVSMVFQNYALFPHMSVKKSSKCWNWKGWRIGSRRSFPADSAREWHWREPW